MGCVLNLKNGFSVCCLSVWKPICLCEHDNPLVGQVYRNTIIWVFHYIYAVSVCKVCNFVCSWSVTSVHLELFDRRQARAARSRRLHLVDRPSTVFPNNSACMKDWKCLSMCVFVLAFIIALMQRQKYAQMCRRTYARTQSSLASTTKLISIQFPFHPSFQARVSSHDSRKPLR